MKNDKLFPLHLEKHSIPLFLKVFTQKAKSIKDPYLITIGTAKKYQQQIFSCFILFREYYKFAQQNRIILGEVTLKNTGYRSEMSRDSNE